MVPHVRKATPPVRPTGLIGLPRFPMRTAHQVFDGNGEPRLGEMIADPIVRRLLASDGVAVDALQDLLSDLRARLDQRRLLS